MSLHPTFHETHTLVSVRVRVGLVYHASDKRKESVILMVLPPTTIVSNTVVYYIRAFSRVWLRAMGLGI